LIGPLTLTILRSEEPVITARVRRVVRLLLELRPLPVPCLQTAPVLLIQVKQVVRDAPMLGEQSLRLLRSEQDRTSQFGARLRCLHCQL